MSLRRYAHTGVMWLMMAVVGAAGCASSGGAGGEEDRGRPDVLTYEQMDAIEASNLFEAVERLRPRWLRIRQSTNFNQQGAILVVRGGTVLGGVEVLRNTSPEGIEELRHHEGGSAGVRLVGSGDGFVEHVIEIVRAR